MGQLSLKHVCVVGILLVGIAGCGSKKLSRSQAKGLIQRHGDFRTVVRVLPSGTGYVSDSLTALRNKGLIVVTLKERIGFGLMSAETYSVALTESGKKFLLKTFQSGELVMKACERKVLEVTGIEQEGDKSAVAHFTYQAINPTPFQYESGCSGKGDREGLVALSLFDDGWRIKQFRLMDGPLQQIDLD